MDAHAYLPMYGNTVISEGDRFWMEARYSFVKAPVEMRILNCIPLISQAGGIFAETNGNVQGIIHRGICACCVATTQIHPAQLDATAKGSNASGKP